MNLNMYYCPTTLHSLGTLVSTLDVKMDQTFNQMKQLSLIEDSENEEETLTKYNQIQMEIESLFEQLNQSYQPKHHWECHSISFNRSNVSIIQGSTPIQERFFKVPLTSQTNVNKTVQTLLQDLVKNISSEYQPVLCSESTHQFESQVQDIWNRMFASNDTQDSTTSDSLELYASFILLDRIKSMSFSLKKRNSLNAEAWNNARDLCVISDAYLGGLFLAHHQFYKTGENGSISYKSMRIISKGTISKIKMDDLEVSYQNWKRDLIENPDSGYPVAYKVQSLQEILERSS